MLSSIFAKQYLYLTAPFSQSNVIFLNAGVTHHSSLKPQFGIQLH